MEQGATFDKVAALYAAARPSYPAALFKDIEMLAGLKPGVRVLEIGCGSGQATRAIAARGYHVRALDPGPQLVRIAREILADSENVEFTVSNFEDFSAPANSFAAIFAAQSWHWIKPDIGFKKAAEILADRGVLAVFGSVPREPPKQLTAALECVYRAHTGYWGPPPESAYLPGGRIPSLFDNASHFAPVIHRSYDWEWPSTTQTFVDFQCSRSDHQLMDQEKRDALLADVRRAIEDFGGQVVWPWQTHLYLTHREPRD